jgi:23S rRNA pseudouridine1911/1915/1917 synthase
VADSSWIVGDGEAGARLDKFLAAPDRLKSRGRASDALTRGKVFFNDSEATIADASRRLAPGDRVRVWMDRPGTAHRRGLRAARPGELEIVYEDDVLVVVNKPPGLLVVPLESRSDAPSVEEALVVHLRSHGKRRPLVVHRIDRDTSGLVVFAKSAEAQKQLKDQFRRREPERVYLAVVHGHPSPDSGVWRDRLVWDKRTLVQKAAHPREAGGSLAISRYRIVEALRDSSLIEVRLITGKRNQIRLQARLHGHTLVGERLYSGGADYETRIPFSRQALHAFRLVFQHPVDGRRLSFEAELPEDLTSLIQTLRPGGTNRSGVRRV